METRLLETKIGDDGNVESPKIRITAEGGLAVKMLANEDLYQGEAVMVTAGATAAVEKTTASTYGTIGFVYADALADQDVWVVISGTGYVKLKDTVAATAGKYVVISDAAGRVDATTGTGIGENLGRALQDVIAGVGKLALCTIRPSFVQTP